MENKYIKGSNGNGEEIEIDISSVESITLSPYLTTLTGYHRAELINKSNDSPNNLLRTLQEEIQEKLSHNYRFVTIYHKRFLLETLSERRYKEKEYFDRSLPNVSLNEVIGNSGNKDSPFYVDKYEHNINTSISSKETIDHLAVKPLHPVLKMLYDKGIKTTQSYLTTSDSETYNGAYIEIPIDSVSQENINILLALKYEEFINISLIQQKHVMGNGKLVRRINFTDIVTCDELQTKTLEFGEKLRHQEYIPELSLSSEVLSISFFDKKEELTYTEEDYENIRIFLARIYGILQQDFVLDQEAFDNAQEKGYIEVDKDGKIYARYNSLLTILLNLYMGGGNIEEISQDQFTKLYNQAIQDKYIIQPEDKGPIYFQREYERKLEQDKNLSTILHHK